MELIPIVTYNMKWY